MDEQEPSRLRRSVYWPIIRGTAEQLGYDADEMERMYNESRQPRREQDEAAGPQPAERRADAGGA